MFIATFYPACFSYGTFIVWVAISYYTNILLPAAEHFHANFYAHLSEEVQRAIKVRSRNRQGEEEEEEDDVRVPLIDYFEVEREQDGHDREEEHHDDDRDDDRDDDHDDQYLGRGK